MIRLRNADRSRGSPAGRFFAKCKTAVVPLIVLLPAICSDQSCGTQSDGPKDTPTPDLQDPVVGMRDRVVQAVRGEANRLSFRCFENSRNIEAPPGSFSDQLKLSIARWKVSRHLTGFDASCLENQSKEKFVRGVVSPDRV